MRFIDEKGNMPIIGFYGPLKISYESKKGWKTPDYLTDTYFEMIHEAGINLINYIEMDYAKEPEAVCLALELADQYHIGLYVSDSALRKTVTKEQMLERIAEYQECGAFRGIHVVDEPGTPNFGPIERPLSDFYQEMKLLGDIPNVVGNVNLLAYHPDWIGVDNNTIWLDRPHYEAYIEEYCEQCAPKMLSADYYIFDAHGVETSKDYFENLEILNHFAQKYDIPFWMYIQLGGQWNDSLNEKELMECYPRPNEVIWNVNTSLASGAKGIAYFPLLQPYYFAFAPDGEMDFRRNGLINANGEKSQWFECVKDANTQIQAVGGKLLHMTHKEMVTVGYYAKLNLPKSADTYGTLKQVEQKDTENQYGFIIGCFDYDGKEAYYVVNNDVRNPQTAVLHFTVEGNCHVISADCDEHTQVQDLEVKLEPARAVLIIIE